MHSIRRRNEAVRRRVVNELYTRFGGACFCCKAQLDINRSGLPGYRRPVVVCIPSERQAMRLACPECAPPEPLPVRMFRERGPHESPSTLERFHAAQGGRCAYCGGVAHLTRRHGEDTATLDHIVPRSRGGRNSDDNYLMACSSCNNAKGDMTPRELIRALWLLQEMLDSGWRPRRDSSSVSANLQPVSARRGGDGRPPRPSAWLDEDPAKPPRVVSVFQAP